MRALIRRTSGIAAAVSLLLAPLGANSTPLFETPPSFDAAKLRGIAALGDNYKIETPVRSDGLMRQYKLATPYGDFAVSGDAMLRMRLNELKAVAALEKISNSDTYVQALAKAGLNPLKYTGRLITDPVGTVKGTFEGIGAMFNRLNSDLSNEGKTPDSAVDSLIGATTERRELAATYGVDPYTDFPPLDAKLKELSQAAALGGLTVSGALLVVPGAAGIVVSNLSTANKINDIGLEDLARKYTAAQILDINRGRLKAMDVEPEVINALLSNHFYTPIDMAALVAALDSMVGAKGRNVFAERAAAAETRATAYFMRVQAEMMAADSRRENGFVRIVALGGLPFAMTRDGRIVTGAPIDALAWTEGNAVRLGAFTAERKEIAATAKGTLRISGQATALAKRQLKAQGWALIEHAPP